MVFREIEMHCDVRLKALGVFELEARDLGHDVIELAFRRIGERRAQIAAYKNPPSGGFEHLANERGYRALSIRAGHGDDRRGDEAARQFELADHRDTPVRGL